MNEKRIIVRSVVIATITLWLAGLLFCLWFGQRQQSAAESESAGNAQQQPAQTQSPVIERGHAGQAGERSQNDQGDTAHWSDPPIVLSILLFLAVCITNGIYAWG